ncbi:MAG: magnesium/cobalt transporter CorA [Acidobacteria bacterium]|nr:magnesium/cobalt transporter CorA [Acidobacteriota bacterium]
MSKRSARSRRAGLKAGLPPGTPVYTGQAPERDPVISALEIRPDDLVEHAHLSPARCREFVRPGALTWIIVDGLHRPEKIQQLGECFGLHPLVIEDILNVAQRPKVEDYGEYLFLVARKLTLDEASGRVVSEQVSLVLGHDYVISFHETHPVLLDGLRERFRAAQAQVRTKGSDYLAYRVLDTIVDNYFLIADQLSDSVQQLEDEILNHPAREAMAALLGVRTSLIELRRAVWPLREVVGWLEKGGSDLIDAAERPYFRDLYDHAVQIMDVVENQRDLVASVHDLYLNSVSLRLNEVMKVLTVIATIFMPLTFIVGVYGMNFEHMPELGWKYGYAVVWGVILMIAALMLVWFRRKRWI